MTDAEIIKWLEGHYTRFAEDEVGTKTPFSLSWIGASGDRQVRGASLRECVERATGRFYIQKAGQLREGKSNA